ncbi:MAG: nucleotidyltransferase domain-containing protein [Candidatus Goldbacteria bacterium]|nr:nucleotidyltransferase domain-containing protein [Candidatus Goldiibacteriota bacterium]
MIKNKLKSAIKIIKEELAENNIRIKNIILFGSRAKGNFTSGSDWDFLIVIDKEIENDVKRAIKGEIRKKLVYSDILADILIISEKTFNDNKDDIGQITYYAVKDGILVK